MGTLNINGILDLNISSSGIIPDSSNCIPTQSSTLTSYNIVDCTTIDCTTINCTTIDCTTINCTTVKCNSVNCSYDAWDTNDNDCKD